MIDLNDVKTFPLKLLKYVEQFGKEMFEETKMYDESAKSIKGRYNPPKRGHFDEALNIAIQECQNQYIKGYHCTKVLDIENIKKNGLNTTKAKENIENFLKLCNSHPLLIPHKDEYRNRLYNWLSDKQIPSRDNKLWFCLFDVSIDSFGCEDFFKYYGGEIIRWHLKKEEKLMKPLEEIGTPIIVTGRLKISTLGLHREFGIGENTLNKAIKELVDKKHPYQRIETFIEEDLKPADILEIIALDKYAA